MKALYSCLIPVQVSLLSAVRGFWALLFIGSACMILLNACDNGDTDDMDSDKQIAIKIGEHEIPLRVVAMAYVRRTVSDTLWKDTYNKMKDVPFGTYSKWMTIPVAEVKSFEREVHRDRGLFWTSMTDDSVFSRYGDEVVLLSDSPFTYSTPILGLDTVTEINPVSLEEVTSVRNKDHLELRYDLGSVKRSQVQEAIEKAFDLPSQHNLRLNFCSGVFITDSLHFSFFRVNYRDPASISAFGKAFKTLPAGTAVIINTIDPMNTNGRRPPTFEPGILIRLAD